MTKIIIYNGKQYTIEIKWGGSTYCLRVVGHGGFHSIPTEDLNDIEKIKSFIIKAINHPSDLEVIEKWDGKI